MRWCLAAVVTAALWPCGASAQAGDEGSHKPRLDMRATPRMAFCPVEILVIGELKGGEDVEDLYCPGLVWDWGDGSRSSHEADCAPYQEGAKLDRLFTARHAFRLPGSYEVQLHLVRAGRMVLQGRIPVVVYGHSEGAPEP
jgi:hypothetical protein